MDNESLVKSALGYLGDAVSGRGSGSLASALRHDVVVEHDAPRDAPFADELRDRESVIDFVTATIPRLVDNYSPEGPLEYLAKGDRVIVLGSLRYRMRKINADVANKEFALVVDLQDGLIGRVIVLKDLTELTEAYLPRGWSIAASVSA